ncbi:MAG: hypothetical protein HY047_20665 [Acidobacteria bacterium]|nr:hypothetical protein [Acidobacteriota bacterium]
MPNRSLASWRQSTFAFIVVVGALTPASVAGQARWTPPRTPDGQPDLQGVWLNNDATPLERPKALEGRQFLTDAEVAQLEERAARIFKGDNSDFAGGDSLFLAALANVDQYRNPNVTGTSRDMIEREFDNRTSLIVDPPDGRIPWTPEGRRRESATVASRRAVAPAGPEDLSNEMRCLTYGVPRIGLNNFNSAGPLGYYQIVQAPGYVVLMLEAIHEARIIPLDGRPHLPEDMRQLSGDSRGRWEGNTLVVDTTNFSRQNSVMGSDEHLHVIERLTRSAPNVITYEIMLIDPTIWSKSWTAVIRLKQSQATLYEYACHEGNFAVIQDILAGSRADEKAAEEAARRPK